MTFVELGDLFVIDVLLLFEKELGDGSPGGPLLTHAILVRDRDQVAVFLGQLGLAVDQLSHEHHHVVEPFRLLRYLCLVDQLCLAAHLNLLYNHRSNGKLWKLH